MKKTQTLEKFKRMAGQELHEKARSQIKGGNSVIGITDIDLI